ncbi:MULTISPECIES: four helix bundle protein [Pedobacter]|jgi:four helix bundle protein|uniref:Four helix bundle protein n=1 Tax=Pedobacter roseus TaxID=336820 RepID=A0A7G9QAE7_9SPHI|nr:MULTISPECIES: four helix bundle protein [Pedobacter]QNN40322.1 four helix bundle protein [Pedobacter roseus]
MNYKLEDLEVYNLSELISDKIWDIVMGWDYFAKDTIGKQICRAADSISANIAEGYGRYHFKENKNFCYYSRGSILEVKSFLRKSKNRNLISEDCYSELYAELQTMHLKLNAYIKYIGKNLNKF